LIPFEVGFASGVDDVLRTSITSAIGPLMAPRAAAMSYMTSAQPISRSSTRSTAST
jgi:branched-subunit amino acid permease